MGMWVIINTNVGRHANVIKMKNTNNLTAFKIQANFIIYIKLKVE